MRLLILSQYYTPEPIPKPSELAAELTKRGHQVNVITGFPNYPEGNLYPGYKLRLAARETIDDVPVVRTYEFPYHGKNAFGRMINYGSFMLSALLGLLFTPRPDVMYVWHPPLTIGITAWVIARVRGVPFVYDIQDIWPESVAVSGMMKEATFLVGVMARIEKFVYRGASHILVGTDGAKENIHTKGVPLEKITVLPNWVDPQIFDSADPASAQAVREQYAWENRFVVLFAGNIGMVQGLDNVIDACKNLPAESDILMVFIGDGTDKARLQQRVNKEGLQQRIQFIDRQPATRMSAFMGAADALLVHLKRAEILELVIPTKTIAYLAAGKPILTVLEGAASDLINEIGAGVVVEPENAQALAAQMEQLRSTPPEIRAAMGAKGREYLQRNLLFDVIISRYETLLKSIISLA